MKSFHLPLTTPKDWFKKINNVWYAKTFLGNTIGNNFTERLHYARDKKHNKDTFQKANVFLVSPELKTFIPVSGYDEHEDGKPLLTEVYNKYGLDPLKFTVYRPMGINTPITQDDNIKLYNMLSTLKNDGYDLSQCVVYTGYLAENVKSPKITALEYLDGKYNTDVVDIPLTNEGYLIQTCFEDFRNIFIERGFSKYNTQKMKEIIRKLYMVFKKVNMLSEKEYDYIIDKIDLYECDKINDQKIEEYLFSFNGFRNTLHNRIRENSDNQKFIDLVGNPKLLSNLLSAM